HYAQQQGTSNEEIIFHENSTTIDVVYGHNEDHGAGEVSGLQRDTGSAFAEFSCGDGVLTEGMGIKWIPIFFGPTCTPTITPTRTPSRTPTITPTRPCINVGYVT